jgi:hypothetical protein
MDIAGLVREGARIKDEIEQRTRILRGIHAKLEAACDFSGKNTARLKAGGYIVKITRRSNVRWNQERLALIRGHYEFFDSVFAKEYKPVGARQLEGAMAADTTFAEAVSWARTESPGSPQVVYVREDSGVWGAEAEEQDAMLTPV